MTHKEYAIWGIDTPNGGMIETLLLAEPGGKPITCADKAAGYVAQLELFGCTALRVQVIQFGAEGLAQFKNMWGVDALA